MKNHRYSIILSILIILNFSCKKDDAPTVPSTSANVAIPLAVGNQWASQTSSWDTTGFPNVTEIDTDRVVRDTTIQLERWFIQRNGVVVTNRSTGYWVMSDSLSVLFLKYPASLNDQYLFRGDTIRVTTMDTSITVAAGTFACLCYQVSAGIPGTYRILTFVAVNKGVIRRELFSRTLSGRTYLASRKDLVSLLLK